MPVFPVKFTLYELFANSVGIEAACAVAPGWGVAAPLGKGEGAGPNEPAATVEPAVVKVTLPPSGPTFERMTTPTLIGTAAAPGFGYNNVGGACRIAGQGVGPKVESLLHAVESAIASDASAVENIRKKNIHESGLVPRKGLEPPRPCGHWYLKPARLPIPPPGQGRRFSPSSRASLAQRT